jgi:serine/threonine protein kinase
MINDNDNDKNDNDNDKNDNDNDKNDNDKNMTEKGGRVLASGGFGCVFTPALKCQGEKKRQKKKVSKLMTEKHAIEEYTEIDNIKKHLKSIKNHNDYFLTYDITLCKPEKLTQSDLINYSKKCKALSKNDITKKNINEKLDELMLLNMPNGGLPVDDYIYNNGSLQKIYNVHIKLVDLFKKGIIQMNDKHIYHCDIKDSNILVDDSLKTRLIDWGLSTEYIPFKNSSFPRTWRNRPFQFNVPFSVIIFTDSFIEKYKQYFEEGGILNEENLKPFVIEYIVFWMKERGAGHYKFINEIMYALFSNDFENISEKERPQIIETQITMPYILNYIVKVLLHFTHFREDKTINLRNYLDNVFIKIVDVWGFICVYYPLIELLFNNYSNLKPKEMKIFNQIKYIYVEYLYTPRVEEINMKELYDDLNKLGNLIEMTYQNKIRNEKQTTIKLLNFRLGGKNRNTRKNKTTINKRNISNTSIIFERGQKLKRFQKPFFLLVK